MHKLAEREKMGVGNVAPSCFNKVATVKCETKELRKKLMHDT